MALSPMPGDGAKKIRTAEVQDLARVSCADGPPDDVQGDTPELPFLPTSGQNPQTHVEGQEIANAIDSENNGDEAWGQFGKPENGRRRRI